jgi:SAM-dependent methyltransferase
MNLGYGDEFHYGECATCGSLTLLDPPRDLQRYYPATGYYSLRTPWLVTAADRGFRARVSHGGSPWLRARLANWELLDTALSAVGRLSLSKSAAILDVGSGRGRLVDELERLGYRSVVGIEPFVPEDAPASPLVRRGTLTQLGGEERFDLVMFHHSLEHIAAPAVALELVRTLLSDHGTLLVRLPLVGPAFDRYGACWYGIDAPRHSFVPTVSGLHALLARCGFRVQQSYFDSTSAQFLVSEEFERGGCARAGHDVGPVALLRRRVSPIVRAAVEAASRANANRTGDQIIIYGKVS